MNICFEGVFGPRAVGLGLSIKELFPSLAADQNHLWSWRNTDAQSPPDTLSGVFQGRQTHSQVGDLGELGLSDGQQPPSGNFETRTTGQKMSKQREPHPDLWEFLQPTLPIVFFWLLNLLFE